MKTTTRDQVLRSLPYLLVVAVQVVFHALDRLPPHWDPARHTELSLALANLALHDGPWAMLRHAVTFYAYYPPGFHLTTALGLVAVGRSVDVAQALQTIYLLATMLVIERLVRRHAAGRWAVLAAFVYGTLPVVLGLSRLAYIENLLALQIALLVWLLGRAAVWRVSWTAVAVGLLLGYGQLTKWNFALLALPFVLVAAVAARRRGEASRPAIAGALAVMAACALMVAGPWTFSHLGAVVRDVRHYGVEATADFPPLGSPASLFFYADAFAMQMVWIPMAVALGAGIALALARGRATRRWALAMIAALALFTLAPNKQGRFVMPLLPVMVAIVTIELARLPRRAHVPVVAMLLVAGTWNATVQTVDLGRWSRPPRVRLLFGHGAWWWRAGTPAWLLTPITRTAYPYERLVRLAREDEPGPGSQLGWILPRDDPAINRHTIAAYAEAAGLHPQWRMEAADHVIWWADRAATVDSLAPGRRARVLAEVGLEDGSVLRLLRSEPVVPVTALPCTLGFAAGEGHFQGFHPAEPDRRWSRDRRARILVSTPAGSLPAAPVRVTLRLGGNGRQRLVVGVNGEVAGSYELGGGAETISLDLAPGVWRPGVNAIELELPDTRPPGGPDPRPLGAALFSVEVR